LLKQLSKNSGNGEDIPQTLTVEPELVIRDSTATVKKSNK